MNIEEAIDFLKNSVADYVIGEYCEKCADNKICDERNEDCYYQQAIDTVVTAYEKEKEKNKELEKQLQSKEIEELKGYHLGFIDGGIAKRYEYQDKIKAKIEEVKDGTFDAKIVLQSLLEKE